MNRSIDQLWHRLLKRPYRLAIPIDEGSGSPAVILLHGIGSSARVWDKVAAGLKGSPYRVLAIDLLGFGRSPKPVWPYYTVDDHARAVIATMLRHDLKRPVVLVGHSMGSLVAVRVARLRPDLVGHLILYQMPLYANLPEKRRYNLRRDMYFRLYNYIIAQPPSVSTTGLRQAILRKSGLELTPDTLVPFTRSLRYTIMQQTTLLDMQRLQMPMDIIYGSLDMVVIRGKPRDVFRNVAAPLQMHTITGVHAISLRASRFIVKRIQAAVL